VFGALLLVLPFSGVRVICVESPAPDDDSVAPATVVEAEARPLTDCERLCPLHPPELFEAAHADTASTDEDADCALSSDAAALQMQGTIAVLRPVQPVTIPDVVSDAPVLSAPVYSEPALANLAPPPKPAAL
jgi:hypothetical protein